jgi:hypothetical protein
MSDESETVFRRGARRSSTSGSGATTVAQPYEEREIVVAFGIEVHNDCMLTELGENIPDAIGNRPRGRTVTLDFTTESDGSVTYVSRPQRVRFRIRMVDTKDAFKTALETPEVHVVYMGHARYGRGPCFGNANVAGHGNREAGDCNAPGDDWEDGTDSTRFGLFRMGFPYIAVPVSEVIRHRYHTSFASTDTPLSRDDCHPDVRRNLRRLDEFSLSELDSEGRLGALCNNAGGPGRRFWGYDGSSHGHRARFVVLQAGWSNTAGDPLDLGATDMQCRVFCHFGCSTFKHNYPILRFRKNWRRTDTDHFAYWTTQPSQSPTLRLWLYHILTYSRPNAFQSWRNSLRYAVRRTNRDLRALRRRYRLI